MQEARAAATGLPPRNSGVGSRTQTMRCLIDKRVASRGRIAIEGGVEQPARNSKYIAEARFYRPPAALQ